MCYEILETGDRRLRPSPRASERSNVVVEVDLSACFASSVNYTCQFLDQAISIRHSPVRSKINTCRYFMDTKVTFVLEDKN